MKRISRPFVKFEVGPIGLESRNQAWKFQVSPGFVLTAPVGDGMAVRSAAREKPPVLPVFWI